MQILTYTYTYIYIYICAYTRILCVFMIYKHIHSAHTRRGQTYPNVSYINIYTYLAGISHVIPLYHTFTSNTCNKCNMAYIHVRIRTHLWVFITSSTILLLDMGWLRSVGSFKLQVSCAKEPYKRDDILKKRPIILRSLQTVATPYQNTLVKHA